MWNILPSWPVSYCVHYVRTVFFNPINQINRVCVTPSKLLSCWIQAVAHVCNTSLPDSQTREWKRMETSTPWNIPRAVTLRFGSKIVRCYIAPWCNLKWEDINTYAVYYRVGGVGGERGCYHAFLMTYQNRMHNYTRHNLTGSLEVTASSSFFFI